MVEQVSLVLLKLAIAIFGVALCIHSSRIAYARFKNDAPNLWVYIARAIVGFYWGALYILLLFGGEIFDPVWFGHIFVRPALLFTLALMLVGSVLCPRE